MNRSLELDGLAITGIGSAVVHPAFGRQSGLKAGEPAAAHGSDGDPSCLHIQRELRLARPPLARVRPGDVVAFEVTRPGAFSEIECSTGRRVPLEQGGRYVGVLGDSSSLSHFTSDLARLARVEPESAHMISVAGMISVATSQSRDLCAASGFRDAPQVTVLGSVLDAATGEPLNTISAALSRSAVQRSGEAGGHPIILLVGTTTNVGKTTLASELIASFAAQTPCAAIKATGTGSLNDSTAHRRAGAYFATSFMEEGLPSTYFLENADVVAAFQRMLRSVPPPAGLPAQANAGDQGPVIVAECGGDLIWAGNPALFACEDLMRDVCAVIVCADNAVAGLGAATMLRALAGDAARCPIFLNLPLVNAEAFMQRVDAYRALVPVAGVLAASAALEFSSTDLLAGASRRDTAVVPVPEFAQRIVRARQVGAQV